MRKLGTYQLGYRMVDLFLDPKSRDGECILCLNGKTARIIVGCASGYQHAWDVLFHEVFELSMADHDVLFTSLGMTKCLSQYLHFMFTHEQYVKIATGAGWFIESCFMDFKNAFNKKGELK